MRPKTRDNDFSMKKPKSIISNVHIQGAIAEIDAQAEESKVSFAK